MNPRRRKQFVWGALVLVLIAAWFAPDEADLTRLAKPLASAGRPLQVEKMGRERQLEALSLELHTRESIALDLAAAFDVPKWLPQSAPQPIVAPLPPREELPLQLPALPFTVLGQYLEDEQLVVFLQHEGRSLIARAGDTLAEAYKVESTDKGMMVFRYLPLNQTQTLELGAAIRDKTDE